MGSNIKDIYSAGVSVTKYQLVVISTSDKTFYQQMQFCVHTRGKLKSPGSVSISMAFSRLSVSEMCAFRLLLYCSYCSYRNKIKQAEKLKSHEMKER